MDDDAPARPGPGAAAPTRSRGRMRPERLGWYVLLILPFVATLVPPFYARETPRLAAWPFFYWWQFAWILITALILAVVYQMTTRRERPDETPHADHGDSHEGEER